MSLQQSIERVGGRWRPTNHLAQGNIGRAKNFWDLGGPELVLFGPLKPMGVLQTSRLGSLFS